MKIITNPSPTPAGTSPSIPPAERVGPPPSAGSQEIHSGIVETQTTPKKSTEVQGGSFFSGFSILLFIVFGVVLLLYLAHRFFLKNRK